MGIIGAGMITQSIHLPVLRAMDGVDVAWLADLDDAKLNAVGRAYGIETVRSEVPADLPACDVALLAIPTGARMPLYSELAKRGTAVFAEKMLAVSPRAHRHVCGLFPAHRLGCGYMRRAYGATRLLAQIIETQWFGDLHHVRVFEGDRVARTGADSSYIDEPGLSGGGVLSAIGCHVLDTVFFVTRAKSFEIVSRHAVLDGPIDRRFQAQIALLGAGAASKHVDFDFCVSWLDKQSNTMEFGFERAVVTASTRPGDTVRVSGKASDSPGASLKYSGRAAGTSNQAFYLEWEEFLDGLMTGTAGDFSGEASLLTAEAVGALYDAIGMACE